MPLEGREESIAGHGHAVGQGPGLGDSRDVFQAAIEVVQGLEQVADKFSELQVDSPIDIALEPGSKAVLLFLVTLEGLDVFLQLALRGLRSLPVLIDDRRFRRGRRFFCCL